MNKYIKSLKDQDKLRVSIDESRDREPSLKLESKKLLDIVIEETKVFDILEKEHDDFILIDRTSEKENIIRRIDKDKKEVTASLSLENFTSISITKLKTVISKLEIKLGGAITCPDCDHEFVLEGNRDELIEKLHKANVLLVKFDKKLIETKKNTTWHSDSIKDLELSLTLFENEEKKSVSVLRGLADKIYLEKEKLRKKISKINDIKLIIENIDTVISGLNQCIKDIDSEIKMISFSERECNKHIVSFLQEIKKLKAEIAVLRAPNNEAILLSIKNNIRLLALSKTDQNTKLAYVEDKIRELNEWAANFKQFRMFLANKSLETMQFQTNKYLEQLGNDMRVKLDGYKVKADGTIKEEITATVIRDGERTFNSFSGGEQVRVLFSSILANRYLINSTHPYGGLDFLGVDEVFDKSDSLGMKFLVRSAALLKTCIMVISHVSDEELTGEEVLTIEKNNGVSIIKE